jgi:predicted transcriptional regulator
MPARRAPARAERDDLRSAGRVQQKPPQAKAETEVKVKQPSAPPNPRTDIILPMGRTRTDDYMAQIASRAKTHEFRRRAYPSTVVRVWFYETAPVSAVTYICEVELEPVRPVREKAGEDAGADSKAWRLPEGAMGNAEYNAFHLDWDGYDYAYRIKSCRRLRTPVTLAGLKSTYGIKGAPQSMVYVPLKLATDVLWDAQELVW